MRNQPAHHLLTILVLVLSTALPITAAADAPLELILVRHAEKVDKSAGSGLTTLGEHRANNLARLLQDDANTHVFSTPYNRTLLTAKPVADHHHLPVIEYDASKLERVGGKVARHGRRGTGSRSFKYYANFGKPFAWYRLYGFRRSHL